jgi:hypothetical protein
MTLTLIDEPTYLHQQVSSQGMTLTLVEEQTTLEMRPQQVLHLSGNDVLILEKALWQRTDW